MRILPPDPGLLIVSCDGAARGNPGPAGIGVQITDEDGNVLAEIAEWIGETTNNVAEYTAALEGLRKAADLGARRVHLRSDSKLLIEQLAGRYKVKASHLRPLHAEVMGLAVRLRARAPPARPPGTEPRGRSAREPRRRPQGLGLGEPLTIRERMDQVLRGDLHDGDAAGPRNVIRTVRPSAAACAGNVTIPSTARPRVSERSDDVTSRALATVLPVRVQQHGVLRRERAPRVARRPAGRTASTGPTRTRRSRGRSRPSTSFPASRRSRRSG